jgi:hypothetical protein
MVAELLSRAADDLDSSGPLARLVRGWQGRPVLDNLPLRVMGAIHADVLAGRAPALAAYYPSAGGHFEPDGAWRALCEHVEQSLADLRPRLGAPIQTNEVRRCCALLGGFLRVAAHRDMPLRCLEIGASAGLNLCFDRYRYALGPHRFGDEAATLELDCHWTGPPPQLDARLHVVARAGCDLRPVDLTDPEARIRLTSFVWPDQLERLERLRRAITVAVSSPAEVSDRRAVEWLPEMLGARRSGVATVVYQSIMWWYLSEEEREAVTGIVHEAGERATAERPLAWLRMEGARAEETEIRIFEWPGGSDTLLGRAHWHGEWVAWL